VVVFPGVRKKRSPLAKLPPLLWSGTAFAQNPERNTSGLTAGATALVNLRASLKCTNSGPSWHGRLGHAQFGLDLTFHGRDARA